MNWISKAVPASRRGKLRERLGVRTGHKIPAGKLAAAARKGGTLGKEARLAQTLAKLRK